MVRNQDGFTIIELMIVLVISAVIILIVFLSVPALFRVKRNYQRRNDAALLLATLEEKISNRQDLPDSCNNQVPGCWVQDVKLGFYDNSVNSATNNVSYFHRTTPWSSDAELANDEIPDTEPAISTFNPEFNRGFAFNRVSIRTYTRCTEDPSRVGHFSRQGATQNSIAAQFLIEVGGGQYKLQCIGLDPGL